MARTDYAIPGGTGALTEANGHLCGDAGEAFPLERIGSIEVASFIGRDNAAAAINERLYHGEAQNEVYRNFLAWLFATFKTGQEAFRATLMVRLAVPDNARILVTGCGNGDDLEALFNAFGSRSISVWAQDVSPEMVHFTAQRFDGRDALVAMSVSDACNLPHPDGFFDLAYHFGGINAMPDTRRAIAEMTRVVRDGGQVFFGDEGVAPWLRGTEYAAMMIANNPIWAAEIPLHLLPPQADAVSASWILGNCFYLVDFRRNDAFPDVDVHVPHLGPRGGSIETRFRGRLEGVDPALRSRAVDAAAAAGMSLSDWLGRAIEQAAR